MFTETETVFRTTYFVAPGYDLRATLDERGSFEGATMPCPSSGAEAAQEATGLRPPRRTQGFLQA